MYFHIYIIFLQCYSNWPVLYIYINKSKSHLHKTHPKTKPSYTPSNLPELNACVLPVQFVPIMSTSNNTHWQNIKSNQSVILLPTRVSHQHHYLCYIMYKHSTHSGSIRNFMCIIYTCVSCVSVPLFCFNCFFSEYDMCREKGE